MGFRGDLKNVQLADILQTLAQNQQEGVLTLANGPAVRRLHFTSAGVVLLDPQVANRRRLGEILTRSGIITQDELEDALREQSRQPRFLGEILIEYGKLKEPELQRLLQVQVEEELYDLFRTMDGTFEFEEGEPDSPPLHHVVPFHVDGIVLEAARRLDEWSVIGQVIPKLDRVYVPAAEPVAPSDGSPEAEEEALVLGQLDGSRTVQSTADALLSSPFAVAKVLTRLKQEHRIREATPEEVMSAAVAALNAADHAQAVDLLESLDPDRVEDLGLVADLANLFREAGRGTRAAELRNRLAQQARAEGDFDEAWRQLREAKKDRPDSIPTLQALVELAREQREEEIESRLLKEMAAVQAAKGDAEGAVQSLERVHELLPNDGEIRRSLVEHCLRARQKSRAVQLLELEANELRSADRALELAAVYKRILAIDPRRNDVRRALSKLRRTAAEKAIRRVGGTVALVVAVTAAVLWMLRRIDEGRAESDMAHARAAIAGGDLNQARSLLQSILDRYTIDTVVFEASDSLREVDEQLRVENLRERQSIEADFDRRMVELDAQMEQRQFADALHGLVELQSEEQLAPFLHDRVNVRLKTTSQRFVEAVARACEEADRFRPPADDASAFLALERLRNVMPSNTREQVSALRELVRSASADPKLAAHQESLMSVLQAADAWNSQYLRIGPEIDKLERRCQHLDKVSAISDDYRRADEAVKTGDLNGAITLYRKVAEEYGEGPLSDSIALTLRHLENADRVTGEIEAFLIADRHEDAAELAAMSLAEYERLDLLSVLSLPVRIASHPWGATVERDGESLGTTPLTVLVRAGGTQVVTLRRAGFEPMRATLDPSAELDHTLWLKKRTRAHVQLQARSESDPVWDGRRILVATRDGALHAVDPLDPGRRQSFVVESLVGSRTRPLPTPHGIVHTLSDGHVWLLRSAAQGFEQRWQRQLEVKLHFTPVMHDDVLWVAGDSELLGLDLANGQTRLSIPLGERQVVAEPLLLGSLLLVPLSGATLRGWDLSTRTSAFQLDLDSNIIGRMTAHGQDVAVVTSSGTLVVVDTKSGDTELRIDQRDQPVAPPSLEEHAVWLSYSKRLLRIERESGATTAIRFEGRPSTPVVDDGEGGLLLGAADGNLYGLRAAERLPTFRTYVGDRPVCGRPLILDDVLVVLCEDGSLRVFDR